MSTPLMPDGRPRPAGGTGLLVPNEAIKGKPGFGARLRGLLQRVNIPILASSPAKVRVETSEHLREVLLLFDQPTDSLGMSPENTKRLAKILWDAACALEKKIYVGGNGNGGGHP